MSSMIPIRIDNKSFFTPHDSLQELSVNEIPCDDNYFSLLLWNPAGHDKFYVIPLDKNDHQSVNNRKDIEFFTVLGTFSKQDIEHLRSLNLIESFPSLKEIFIPATKIHVKKKMKLSF